MRECIRLLCWIFDHSLFLLGSFFHIPHVFPVIKSTVLRSNVPSPKNNFLTQYIMRIKYFKNVLLWINLIWFIFSPTANFFIIHLKCACLIVCFLSQSLILRIWFPSKKLISLAHTYIFAHDGNSVRPGLISDWSPFS